MAGINVNQITSTLARLPDPALQQYAAMHKNDPYIMSLAVSESNRRKELRAAGQASQGMQPQPKVAEAAIAQMAPQPMPQEMGIAALPAQNMQQMADGGIVGYDEGGMAYGQEPVMMMAEGGVARYQSGGRIPPALLSQYQQEAQEMGMGTRMQFSPEVRSVVDQIRSQQQGDYLKSEQAQMLRGPSLMGGQKLKTPEEEAKAQFYAEQDKLMKGYTPRRAGDEFEGEEAGIAAREAAKPVKPVKPAPAKGKDSGKANIKPPPAPVAAAAAADPSKEGIAALFKASTAAELGAEAEALSKKDIARMEKEYSPFLEELKAEKEALGKRKDSNAAEALVRAGLSIAGGKSRNALENIAAGAEKGFSAYTEAQKADEAARRALRQSEMSIMQAQRAERSGYHKDAIALSNQARQERQFAISSAQQAEQIKNTKAYQEGSLANQRIVAEASRQRAANAGGGMSKEAKLRLEQLKAYAANLKSDPMYQAAAKQAMMPGKIGADAKAAVKQYEAKLAQVNAAIAQAAGLDTMVEASPASAGSGIDLSQWGKSQVVKP